MRKSDKNANEEAAKQLRRDPYVVLGVSRNSTDQEIKTAYRKMALKYHPDKNANDPKAADMFKEVTFSYNILSDPEKRRQFDTAGFEAVESDGQELELDLSSLGAVNTMFAALFSKLGVPIKTTVSAGVLEEALNGMVSIRPLPLGQPVFRKVEKQCAHFYSVTITENEAGAGLVCRVQSADKSKFKLLYFDQEGNAGLSLALQEDCAKTGKVTSAGMYFLGFPTYHLDRTVNSMAAAKDTDTAFFKKLDGFQPCEITELKAGTHVFAVYGDNFFKSVSYTIEVLCAAPFTEEKDNLRAVEAQILSKRVDISKFETEYREVLAQFTEMTSRYAQEMQSIDELLKQRSDIQASYTAAPAMKRSGSRSKNMGASKEAREDGQAREKTTSMRDGPKKKKWYNIPLKVDKRKPCYVGDNLCAFYQCSGIAVDADQTAQLFVNASKASSRKIPENLFGIFFEEINHAGAGGLWAELVQNRGFEAGGQNTPSNIYPWSILGDESSVLVSTDRSSCFDRNKIALRLEVLCDSQAPKICPSGGVGISNPGFWGMNIEQGKSYKLVLYVSSSNSINLSASLSDSTGLQTLATANIVVSDLSNWTKVEVLLEAKATDPNSKLQLTTTQKGVIWFDQVSLMPLDTYKGHGSRNDLFRMLADIKPGFIRFPGGCFVEGEWLRNAFRWKETIGPWEERPGHFGDVWNYWTDDGLGHFEFFQLAEDLGAVPIWVFNNGISHTDQVDTANILPFIREILDGLEFAKGDANSTWGSVRAAMGHPEPFDLRYVAIGNEDCGKKNYRGNYLKFYDAIKRSYPDIKIISNCDGSSQKLDHPADMYDYHIYSDAKSVFSRAHAFDHSSRSGPKAFVSEYAVTGDNAGKGSLLAALAEAGFLIGLERNSDIVEMASYAPLFVNVNDRRWNPDAIVFNSAQLYGTPSYWMQYFFKESNGATLLNSTLQTNSSASLIASAIIWQNTEDNKNYLRLKLVNFGDSTVNLKISIDGLELNSKPTFGSTKTVLTSTNLMDENSFSEPKKVAPVRNNLEFTTKDVDVKLSPHSFTSVDLLTLSNISPWISGTDGFYTSS